MATQQRLTHVLLDHRTWLPIITRSEVDRQVEELLQRRQEMADELGLAGVIDEAPTLGWSVHDVDTTTEHTISGYRASVLEREVWLRYFVGNTIIGAEKSRMIWAAVALGFSPTPSTSEVSLEAALRNLRRRIERSGR